MLELRGWRELVVIFGVVRIKEFSTEKSSADVEDDVEEGGDGLDWLRESVSNK